MWHLIPIRVEASQRRAIFETHKIASLEIVDLPLIQQVAATAKSMIMPSGTAEAVDAARGAGCDDLTVLVCTSCYPAASADAKVRRILALAELFGVKVGFSDPVPGVGVSAAASALGAIMIEIT